MTNITRFEDPFVTAYSASEKVSTCTHVVQSFQGFTTTEQASEVNQGMQLRGSMLLNTAISWSVTQARILVFHTRHRSLALSLGEEDQPTHDMWPPRVYLWTQS